MDIQHGDTLALAAETVRAGGSVEVVGSHGSGKSTFLKNLNDILRDGGWNTLFIRGIASLKQFPLAALNLPGVLDAGGEVRGIASIHQVTFALQAKVSGPNSVIFIDDWNELDEASWGIIDSVHRAHSVPVVFSHLQGARASSISDESYLSRVPTGYVVEMRSLRIDELGAVLKTHLNSPIERGALSRVYAMTGGHIGLALALVKAARRENQLVQDSYGVWTSTDDLWSSGLTSMLETYVSDLPTHVRDSLEVLASVGTVDLDIARKLVEVEVLELLEERGLTTILSGSVHDWVMVIPPLLVEYFRRAPASTRKDRLNRHILERIGEVEPAAVVLAGNSPLAPIVDGREALFAALAREQVRTRITVASADWVASQTPRNAVGYITALMQSPQADSEVLVEQVFRDTDFSTGEIESHAELIVLHANWLAHVQGKVDDALELLRTERNSFGDFGRLLDAAEVTILTNLVRAPSDSLKKLKVTHDLPVKVQLALLEAQMLIFVTSCRFNEAHQAFERIRVLDPLQEQIKPRVLFGFMLLGEGRHAEALHLLTHWLEEAREQVDIQGVRSLACALALCHSQSGDHFALDRLAEVVAAVGGPTSFPSNPQVATVSVTTSVVAARRGDTLLTERFVREAQRQGIADGPLPAQSLAWPIAQLMILQGELEHAAEELWRSGEKLWAREARYAGMLEMFVSIEIHPNAERLGKVNQLLKLVPENVSLQAQGIYVTALVKKDPESMLRGAEALVDTGRFGLAASAYAMAEAWFENAGNAARATDAHEAGNRARSRIGGSGLDVSRFSALPAVLSRREEQVARLVAHGLTNREIATELYLSARTVDGHVSRIFRKLKLKNRRALEEYFTDQSGI